MPTPATPDQTLLAENARLRARLEAAEEMLRAIRAGEVDGLVGERDAAPRLFTLQGLDAEQNRFRSAMLAQVSDAVVTTDSEERITFLNSAAEQQYRVRSADVLGRKVTALYTRQWPSPEAEAAALAALKERGHWRGEKLHCTRDGRELPVETSIAILHDPETGQRAGLILAIRDITERKEAEAALRQNTALFSKIIEQAPGGVYVVDAQFRVAQMNAESLPFFAAAAPLIGRDFDEALEIVWGPEIGPQIATIFRHTLATGERYISPRFSEQRHDLGVEQAFEWETQRITLPDGQHGVVCYFQDVTAREHSDAARRESEERLNLAVKCSQVVLFQQDLELRYTWLQNAMLGFEDSVAIGKREADLMEHAADAVRTEALKREVIRSGVSQRQEVLVQIAGVSRHFDLLVEPQRDAAGLISGVTGAAIEITARKQAAESLREAKEAAEAANRSKDRFLAALSHELRTPLTPVLLVSEVHAKSKKLSEDLREDFEMIHRNIVLEAQLIDDLLDVSRIQQGKMRFDFKLVNVHEAIARALEMLRSEVEEKGIAVRQELRATPATLEADPKRLRQVLCNLLRNAVKFTPHGGTITVHTARDQSALQISIADTGAGLAAENLERIFQPFEQVDTQQKGELSSLGLGLGLAISAAIISAHRGRIWAESPGPNQGATFHVRLPF